MQGEILDVYTIVPQYKGKYPLPEVSFSYFDPKAKTYKRLTSEQLVIDVVNGPSSVNTDTASNNTVNTNKQAVTTNSSTFSFIKTNATWISKKEQSFFLSNIFWLFLITLFL